MGDITKTLKFLIVGDAAGAVKAFKDTGQSAESVAAGGKNAGAGLAAFTVAMAAGVKVAGDAVSKYKSVGAETLKLARVTGESAEDASRLRFALKETGIDADKGASLMAKFSKTLEGASAGSKAEAGLVQDLGFAFRDAAGHILPMSQLLPKVAERFATMPDGAEKTALAMQLFGKSGADMLVFLNKGASGLAELSKRSDEFGATLSGPQLAALKEAKQAQKDWDASIEGLQISLGGALLPLLTKFSQGINSVTPAIKAATDTTTPLGQAVVALGIGLGALVVTQKVIGFFSDLTVSVRSARDAVGAFIEKAAASKAIQGMSSAMGGLSAAAGPLGIALVVGGVALAGFFDAQERAKRSTEEFTAALEASNGVIDENVTKIAAKNLQDQHAFEAARTLGLGLDVVTQASLGNKDALAQVNATIEQYKGQTQQVTMWNGQTATSFTAEAIAAGQLEADLGRTSTAMAGAVKKQADLAAATGTATSALYEHGGALDQDTEAGRANKATLDTIAAASQQHIQQLIATKAPTDEVTRATAAASEEISAAAQQMGISTVAADALAASYRRVPSGVSTTITADASAALATVDRVRSALASLDGTAVYTRIMTTQYMTGTINLGGGVTVNSAMLKADGGIVEFFAGGGLREDHKAQIAPAGAWRIWAEPETGGEAYLPLAPAKRSQTIPIAKEAVRRLGGVATFANGGVSGGRSSGGGDIHLHVTVPPGADPHSNARAIVAALRAFKRAEGGQAVLV